MEGRPRLKEVKFWLTDGAGVVLQKKKELEGKKGSQSVAELIRGRAAELALLRKGELTEDEAHIRLGIIFDGIDIDRYPREFAAAFGIERQEFFGFVYDVGMQKVIQERATVNNDLVSSVGKLELRRGMLTNGTERLNGTLLRITGMEGLFEIVIGAEALGDNMKPSRMAYQMAVERIGLPPGQIVYFDDKARNHVAPHSMGMFTVFIGKERDTQGLGRYMDMRFDTAAEALEVIHAETSRELKKEKRKEEKKKE